MITTRRDAVGLLGILGAIAAGAALPSSATPAPAVHGETIRAGRHKLAMCVEVERQINGRWTKVRARWVNVARGLAAELGDGSVPHLVRGRYRLSSDTQREEFAAFAARQVERYGCVMDDGGVCTP